MSAHLIIVSIGLLQIITVRSRSNRLSGRILNGSVCWTFEGVLKNVRYKQDHGADLRAYIRRANRLLLVLDKFLV